MVALMQSDPNPRQDGENGDEVARNGFTPFPPVSFVVSDLPFLPPNSIPPSEGV